MTPESGSIEHSFTLVSNHTEINTCTKFGNNEPRNLKENWSEL